MGLHAQHKSAGDSFPPLPSPSAPPPVHTHTLSNKNDLKRSQQFGFPKVRTGARIQTSRNENVGLEPHCTAKSGMGLGCSTVCKLPKRTAFLGSGPRGAFLTFGRGPVDKCCSSLMPEIGVVSSLPIPAQLRPEGETQGLLHCPLTPPACPLLCWR